MFSSSGATPLIRRGYFRERSSAARIVVAASRQLSLLDGLPSRDRRYPASRRSADVRPALVSVRIFRFGAFAGGDSKATPRTQGTRICATRGARGRERERTPPERERTADVDRSRPPRSLHSRGTISTRSRITHSGSPHADYRPRLPGSRYRSDRGVPPPGQPLPPPARARGKRFVSPIDQV